jgi:hypothetical protein
MPLFNQVKTRRQDSPSLALLAVACLSVAVAVLAVGGEAGAIVVNGRTSLAGGVNGPFGCAFSLNIAAMPYLVAADRSNAALSTLWKLDATRCRCALRAARTPMPPCPALPTLPPVATTRRVEESRAICVFFLLFFLCTLLASTLREIVSPSIHVRPPMSTPETSDSSRFVPAGSIPTP